MRKTYHLANLAFLLTMLLTTLASCEKFTINEETTATSTNEANSNVFIHLSVAKKSNYTESTSRTSLTRGEGNTAEKSITDYCTRLSIGIFDGAEKVKTLNLTAEKDGFEDIGLYLEEGQYRMVVIGHNGNGNSTISAPEKVKFSNNKLTDTFYYYGTLNVSEKEDTEKSIQLNRAVAQVQVHFNDSVIPENAHSIQFYYTGGSSTLDATTGYGCVKSRQTETINLEEGKKDYAVYTFPREESNGLSMTISLLNAEGKSIKEFSRTGLPVKTNNITKANISAKDSSTENPDEGDGEDDDEEEGGWTFTINPDWDGEINVDF